MLTCSKCGQEKDESEFSKRSERPKGYASQCKACNKAYNESHSENYKQLRANNKVKFAQQLQENPVEFTSKVCTCCGIEKPNEEFYKAAHRKDGLTCHCRACQKEYREDNAEHIKIRVRNNYINNREENLAQSAQYREDHYEELKEKWRIKYYSNRNMFLERNKKNYIKHRETRIKAVKEYYKSNRDTILERAFLYAQTPQGRATQARGRHNRYYKEKETECTLTGEQWLKIIASQNNKCAMCGKPFTKRRFPTRDHIVPASKNGGLTFENVQALCHSCNSTKRDKLDHSKIITWLAIPTG